ncbi:hypothetical protein D3248_00055 [Leucobacter zeae]|nr:hypothetical protein [Leucobacter zeae]
MPERIPLREYETVAVSPAQTQNMKRGAALLDSQLRPSIQQFRTDGQSVSFGNVVGSFSLPNGDVIQVAPKIAAGDWTTAIVHLLSEDTRLAVTGSQQSRPSARRDDLTAALALEYARRLERAIRQDGPMQVYERRHETGRRWRGRLDVTEWARRSALDPARFPMGFDELSVVNDFTRGLSVVAGLLGRSAAGSETASRLRRLQNEVIPGSPIPSFVNRSISRRRMPTQWAAYAPAWDIAAPILRSQSVVGDPGRATGLEVAVEPWRMLETYLERALHALVASEDGVYVQPKLTYPLLSELKPASAPAVAGFPKSVEPDGLLIDDDGHAVATFEAKYSNRPKREHVFQALATAAALASPLAVLLYPWREEPRVLDVAGFHSSPSTLVAVGVGLFEYRRGRSDRKLAATIGELLRPIG